MLKRIQTIYYALVFLCIAGFSVPAWSAPLIDVKNAEAKQGEIVKVRVEVDFDNLLPEGTSSVSLNLSYITTRLSFRKVTGGTAAAGCATPDVVEYPIDENSGAYGFITITCNDIQRSNDNAAFDLEFFVLGGPDTTALIEPKEIMLNGDTLQSFERSVGVVRFTGDEPRVFPTYPEGLGLNTPNPFYLETVVNYTIEKATPIRFKIFDHLGKKVLEDALPSQPRGVYTYTISTFKQNTNWVHTTQSSGLYILVMETDSGVYYKKIMLLK